MLKLNPSYIELMQFLRVEIGVLTVYLSSRRPEFSERWNRVLCHSYCGWGIVIQSSVGVQRFNSVMPLWKGIFDAL